MENYNSPFFSVIISTYNRDKFISNSIKSVLEQTFQDFELIVIDDASTDTTSQIINRLKDANPKIRILKNSINLERSLSRNKAIMASKGRFITFLDDDDYYLPQRLEIFFEFLENYNDDIFVLTGKKTFDSKTGKISNINYPVLLSKFLDPLNTILDPDFQFATQQALFSSSLIKSYPFCSELKMGEDIELFLRISLVSKPLFLENPTVVMIVHGSNSTSLKNNPGLERQKWLDYLKQKPEFQEKIEKQIWKKHQARIYFNLFSYENQYNGLWNAKTFKFAFKSIFLEPNKQLKQKLVCLIYSLPGGKLVKLFINMIKRFLNFKKQENESTRLRSRRVYWKSLSKNVKE